MIEKVNRGFNNQTQILYCLIMSLVIYKQKSEL